MYRNVLVFLLLIMLTSSCFLRRKTASAQAAQTSAVPEKKKGKTPRKPSPFRYGTPREEVLAAITDRSEIMVAEFNDPRGHLVAYQYRRYGKAGYKEPVYYLYFMNDTLIRKSAPEPLEVGAHRAIKEYYSSEQD